MYTLISENEISCMNSSIKYGFHLIIDVIKDEVYLLLTNAYK